jgi:hypothetical protein
VLAQEPQDPADGVAGGVAVVQDVEGAVAVGDLDQLDGEAASLARPDELTFRGGRPKVGRIGTPRSARWRWLMSAPPP